jgi:uncharacterized Zn-binding protein involved in type VI secretion
LSPPHCSPGTVHLPYIQLKAYSSEALDDITYSLSNSSTSISNISGFVTDQTLSAVQMDLSTCYFQCYDIVLAPGTNVLTRRCQDIAGNVTTSNYTYILASSTNLPVITMGWPTNGSRLTGTNFSMDGWLNDPTARITLSQVNTNGATNVYGGLVERYGRFWIENVPILPGTNTLTLTATDAWSNSISTNITIIKGSMVLTIDPIGEIPYTQTSATITGTVSDPSATVFVNGVQATVTGTNWSAAGVPVPSGTTASFRVKAYPPDPDPEPEPSPEPLPPGPSVNEFEPEPSDPEETSASVDRPMATFMASTIQGSFWYSFSHADVWTTSGYGQTPDNWHQLELSRGYGNSWARVNGGSGEFTDVDHETASTPQDDSRICPNNITWPAGQESGYIVDCTGYTNYGNGWFDLMRLEFCQVSDSPSTNILDHNIPYNYWQDDQSHELYTRSAFARQTLFTGGKSIAGDLSLFTLAVSATEVTNTRATPPFGYDFALTNIPPSCLRVGSSQVGEDGLLHIVLPDGEPFEDTVSAPGYAFYVFGAEPDKDELSIAANGINLDPMVTNATFCVGQRIQFSLTDLPSGVTATNFQWSFEGHYFNARSNTVPGKEFPDCSRSYYIDTNLLAEPTSTNNWWVSGGFNPVPYRANVSCTLVYTNGEPSQLYKGSGLFGMARPRATISPVTKSVDVWTNPYGVRMLQFGQPTTNSTDHGITFYYTLDIPPGFSGSPGWIQTIVNAPRTAMESNGTQHVTVYPAFPNLDSIPGAQPLPYLAFDNTGTNAVDSPGQSLDIFPSNYVSVTGSGTFNMWMMFTPSGGVSVPLQVVNWSWSGSATNNGTGWSLVPGSATNSPNPAGQDTENYPLWINNITNNSGWSPHL